MTASPLISTLADQYLRLASTFKGTISQSGLDPRPNAYRHSTFRHPNPHHSQPLDPKFDSAYHHNGELHWRHGFYSKHPHTYYDAEEVLQDTANEIEATLQAKLSKRKEQRIQQPLRPSLKRRHPMSSLKRCFKCKAMGHIQVHCPYKIRPMLRRK